MTMSIKMLKMYSNLPAVLTNAPESLSALNKMNENNPNAMLNERTVITAGTTNRCWKNIKIPARINKIEMIKL